MHLFKVFRWLNTPLFKTYYGVNIHLFIKIYGSCAYYLLNKEVLKTFGNQLRPFYLKLFGHASVMFVECGQVFV